MWTFAVPDNWYGPGTDKIRSVVARVQGIRWFDSRPSDDLVRHIVPLAQRHLHSLSRFHDVGVKVLVPKVRLFEGDWSVLHQERWGIDPHDAWGDRWAASAGSLGRVAKALRCAVDSSDEALRFLRPPLWPFENLCNVCGPPLIADDAVLINALNMTPGGRDWCVAWALLCRAEFHCQNALLWELASALGLIEKPNPFLHLLKIYELGCFPMGWAEDCLEVYVPKLVKRIVASSGP